MPLPAVLACAVLAALVLGASPASALAAKTYIVDCYPYVSDANVACLGGTDCNFLVASGIYPSYGDEPVVFLYHREPRCTNDGVAACPPAVDWCVYVAYLGDP